jgi:aspartate/methionine/tyrosine aminotransferase
MLPAPFELERYFARYEFKVRRLLSASDCQALKLSELLALADDECRAWWDELALHYTESQGHPRLRKEVAALHHEVNPDDVLIAAPEEAIFLAMQTLVQPGDHVVVLTPCYQALHEVVRAHGCEVSAWPLQLDDGGWRLDVAALRRLLTPRTRLLVVNFPHNPTGHQPSHGELEEIIAIARDRNLYLFSDEMYQLLEPEPALRLPSICDVYEKGVTLSGLSKSFGLPGLRIGWLIARERRLIDAWLTLKDYTTICNDAPSEVLAVIALRAKRAIVERNLGIIAANLRHADAFFATHKASFRWLPPRAGSVAFPEWRGPISLEELCTRALDDGMMIVPGRLFGHDGTHFRVGLGRTDFPQALEELAALL